MLIYDCELAEGKRIPKWYGVAYFDFSMATLICYPIPINIVVKYYQSLKRAFKCHPPSWWEKAITAAIEASHGQFFAVLAEKDREIDRLNHLLGLQKVFKGDDL